MLKIRTPPAIIFDKDGTLIDVHHYWIEMSTLRIRILLENFPSSISAISNINSFLLGQLGIDMENRRIHKDGPAGVITKKEIINIITKSLNQKGYDLNSIDVEQAFLQADEESRNKLNEFLKILPGVENIIKLAKRKQIDLNLVSNDITERSKLALSSLGFLEDFRFVFGQDEVKQAKPSPDLAHLVIAKGGYKTGLVNIGDHPNDIRMGLAAGITNNVALLTGLSKKEDFKDLDCFVIKSLEELVFI